MRQPKALLHSLGLGGLSNSAAEVYFFGVTFDQPRAEGMKEGPNF